VTLEQGSVARDLLTTARLLADRPDEDTTGLWPRAAVLLARQSLEVALATYWSAKAPGVESCSTRAQLLCLGHWLSNERLGRRAHHVWSVLSGASHYHPYDLAPTREELVVWCDTVSEVIHATEREWRD
jgi:hypothetical protein